MRGRPAISQAPRGLPKGWTPTLFSFWCGSVGSVHLKIKCKIKKIILKIRVILLNCTPKQKQAIEIRDREVLVSAAAGSGKTTVLVERLARQLADKNENIPADRMIIVTFTNDAAAQMRRRLMKKFSELIANDPDDLWLAEQFSKLESAKICTISSFCFDLIRENVGSTGLSPDFRIMDDQERELITSAAVDNVFERWYSDRPEDMRRLCDAFCIDSDAPLENAVREVIDFLSVLPFPDKAADDFISVYSETDPDKSPFSVMYARQMSKHLEHAAEYGECMISEAGSLGSKNYAMLNEEYTVVKSAYDAFNAALIGDFSWENAFQGAEMSAFSGYKFGTLRFGKADECDESEKENIKLYRDKMKECAAAFKALMLSGDDVRFELETHSQLVPLLFELAGDVQSELWNIKLEKGGVCFSDGEQLAVRLLTDTDGDKVCRSALCERLSEFYKVIMIDEYQDVNDAQDMLFRLIAHENGDDLFCVGDVKQAIYGFRLANPQIFINVLNRLTEYEDGSEDKNVSVTLNRNFRSSHDVVDFVNTIFRRIMTVKTAGLDYTGAEALVCGADYNDRPRMTEFLVTKPSEDTAEDIPENDDEYGGEESEAELLGEADIVAERIRIMLKNGDPVYENGADRPCRASDFCVLKRTKTGAEQFAQALEKRGIKAVCESKTAYLDSYEIAVMLNMLKIIDNPLSDIPLISVLMSPDCGLDADDAAALRIFERSVTEDKKVMPLYASVRLYLENGDMGSALYRKLSAFSEMISSLREYASGAGVWELVMHIYNSTVFMSVMQASGDGEQKCANLRLLTEYVKKYEASSNGGLNGFLRYIDDLRTKKKDLPRASTVSASDDAVQIKTIHKSKGLEFPFVFLCGTFGQFNMSDLNKPMIMNREFGVSFRIQDREKLVNYPSVPYTVMREAKRRELAGEEMRLLYVALTRAKEKLFITLPDREKLDPLLDSLAEGAFAEDDIAESSRYIDWILGGLCDHPDMKAFYGEEISPSLFAVVDCDKLAEMSEAVGKAEDIISETASPDENIVRDLEKMCSADYDAEESKLAAKLTVTEIAKSTEQVVISPNILDLPDSPHDITAAELGTATHTFMQYADFESAESDIESAILDVCDHGHITEDEAERLDRRKLMEFFRSPLYIRMKNSKKTEREKKFLVEISDLSLDDELGKVYNHTRGMLQGIADAVFFEDDGAVLIDYKTDRHVTDDILKDRYGLQLKLYAKALGLICGVPVKEAYIYSFGLSKAIPCPI